ncbi:MAG TPA: hypothetical protein VL625_12440 [Patescibacteria group bacterium]|jgi:hypothetical protein|nr:hypothetical protein [Patescibacteria group bacterium]
MGMLVKVKRPISKKLVLNEKLRLHIERELAARAANHPLNQKPLMRRTGGNKASG